MGGEGAPWIGMAPFTSTAHIFQNMGDGTYFHSGAAALQACVAAGVNITFKLLYNGHVAMTGGQDAAGARPIPELTHELAARGVKKIVVLAEDTAQYAEMTPLAPVAELRERDELPQVLEELPRIAGVTVMIYDQECAAEKRRKRARGTLKEPVRRLAIHSQVCEGCGDCVTQSNCVSLTPLDTAFGQKMQIHQSSCNKDYTCALGDCPSFITVEIAEGTGLEKRVLPALPETGVPAPRDAVQAAGGYRVVSPGIGGTGVITINALLATAATLDGLCVLTLDQTGLAQKGGAVVSHIVFSERPIEGSNKVNTGNADLILGFDLLGAGAAENLKTAERGRTRVVANSNGGHPIVEMLNEHTDPGRNVFVDASRMAEALFGSHLPINVFLLGVAFQAGLLPLSAGALEEAVRLNGVEVERNLQAFLWGRKYYADAAWVEAQVAAPSKGKAQVDFAQELRAYQSEAYAREYREFLERVAARAPVLRDAVARSLYKLMAYKDEYEVARLLVKREVEEEILGQFESPRGMYYNLHPPLLRTFGIRKKWQVGGWFKWPLRAVASLKWMRGYLPFRREERGLIAW